MKHKILFLTTITIFTTILLGGLITLPSNTPYSIWNTGDNGYSILYINYGFKPLHELKGLINTSTNTVIIYPVMKQIPSTLRRELLDYINNGGILVLLDENGYSNEFLYMDLNLSIIVKNYTIYDEIQCYDNDRSMPIIKYYNLEIVSYKPKYIQLISANNTTILGSGLTSKYSYADIDNDEYYTPGDRFDSYIVVLKIRIHKGVIYLISDYDIFTNKAIMYEGNKLFLEREILGNNSINTRYILVISSNYGIADRLKEIILYTNGSLSEYTIPLYTILILLAVILYLGDKHGIW